MAYKKNDIVRFISNQPSAHVIEMFGHYQGLKPEDATPDEYIGRVKSVISNGTSYIVSTIAKLKGFICVLDADEITGKADLSELSEEEKKEYYDRTVFFEAPNVYDNDPSDLDDSLSLENKCRQVATKAMAALFPDAVTKGFSSFGIYDYRLERYLESMNGCLEFAGDKPARRQAKLAKKRDELEALFRKMRFKEYYSICLGVEEDSRDDDLQFEKVLHEMLVKQFGKETADREHDLKPRKVVRNWLIAIDLNFEEVSIMRDISERSNFLRFLGPEHYRLEELKSAFASECLK